MRVDLVTAFIVVYLYFAWSWPAPSGSPWKRSIGWLAPIVHWLGLTHRWDMFTGPIRSLRHLEASIDFASGERVVWQSPALDRLGPLEAFLAARHRKYQNNLFSARSGPAKRALVHHLWSRYRSPEDPPVRIDIFVRHRDVPPPDAPHGPWPPARRFLVYTWNATLGEP